jgi:hypothetical protein
MVAHRWLGPVTDTSDRCDCLICMRHDEWIDEMQIVVREYVGRLLALGWPPIEIVRLVKSGSPVSSHASMLVRVEVVSRAGEWSTTDGFGSYLAQARMLSERMGFVPGRTDSSWFEEWHWYRGGGDSRNAERFVNHLRTAIEPVLHLLGDCDGLPERRRLARSKSRPTLLANGLERGMFVPEATHTLWEWRD